MHRTNLTTIMQNATVVLLVVLTGWFCLIGCLEQTIGIHHRAVGVRPADTLTQATTTVLDDKVPTSAAANLPLASSPDLTPAVNDLTKPQTESERLLLPLLEKIRELHDRHKHSADGPPIEPTAVSIPSPANKEKPE